MSWGRVGGVAGAHVSGLYDWWRRWGRADVGVR